MSYLDSGNVNTSYFGVGVDINFWIKDETATVHDSTYALLGDKFELNLRNSGSGKVELFTRYDSSQVQSDEIYTDTTSHWINIQIFAKNNSHVVIYAWDEANLTLEPKVVHQFDSSATLTGSSLNFLNTLNNEGVYFAEVRVFRYDPTF